MNPLTAQSWGGSRKGTSLGRVSSSKVLRWEIIEILFFLQVMVQVGIKTMAKNEKAQFMINHNYGYGRFGCPPRIPEQATILGGDTYLF